MQNYRQNSVATGRRGPGPMVAPPPHSTHPAQAQQPTHEQIQRQMQEENRKRERARNRSLKPTDRDIPEELGDVVVGESVQSYRELRELERKLDATMVRKRLDITDNVHRRYLRREGTMRVWISNTAEGQPWQVIEEGEGMNEDGTFEFGDQSSQATYRVKVEGKLLEDERDEEDMEGLDEEEKERQRKNRSRFSQFFKAITIDFDRNPALQADNMAQIEWRKPHPPHQRQSQSSINLNPAEASFDCLEFERKSDENINITISLTLDVDPGRERYKLSPQLAEILDCEEEDRAGAVQGIWEYCRAMGLQEDSDRRSVVCDDALRKLFGGQGQVYFPYMPDLLSHHMTPIPPTTLDYTIRVDKSYISPADSTTKPSAPTIYDVPVPLPNPLHRAAEAFHTSKHHMSSLRSIVQTDDDLALLVQKIHQTNAKLKFYTNLSKDPANFVKRWISSQQRDLEVVLAEAQRGGGGEGTGGGDGEEWRRGGEDGLWGSEVTRESVGLWLARAKGH